MERVRETSEVKKKPGFLDLLSEDDAPEIGIATKEPLGEYIRGVKAEFKRIEWPSKNQVVQEFFTVVVIVTIIATIVYAIDLGLDKLISTVFGA